jgi:uncharacterized membrane protein YedE/YeeE
MKRSLAAFAASLVSGVLFGIGLSVARMTDPDKIRNFLDLASIPKASWDPSLAFVMAGGLVVAAIGLRLDRRMRRPLAAPSFHRVQRVTIDAPLVIGAALFGIGWGMAGFCPGPAIAALGLIPGKVIVFVVAMFVGSWIAGHLMARGGTTAPEPRLGARPA